MTNYYTEEDLVKFGNYLLSEKRKESFIVHQESHLHVNHADLENYKLENPPKSLRFAIDGSDPGE